MTESLYLGCIPTFFGYVKKNRQTITMNSYSDLNEQIETLLSIGFILLILLLSVIIRNWYNLYKKRSFRKKNEKLKIKLENREIAFNNYNDKLKIINNLKQKEVKSQSEILNLKNELKKHKQEHYATLDNKEKEISDQKRLIDLQQKAYERYADYKNVEANNTRLGSHFMKNVITQIYEDLENAENSYKTFLGYQYKKEKDTNKIPSIKALKNIFKLLDYNVAALNNEGITLENEVKHINMFLELINYLKPNAKIELNNTLNKEQLNSIKIKPTLFFPFVENALKHGSLNENNSFINISLKENDQNLLSYCLVNSTEQTLDDNNVITTQFGLNALKQLINVYYPGSKLKCTALPNKQYMSELTLKLK